MTIRRRDFLTLTGAAALTASLPRLARSADSVYDLERFGNARILHMTDTHAQLLPVFFRERGQRTAFVIASAAKQSMGRLDRHSACRASR